MNKSKYAESRPWLKWYKTAAWQRLRFSHLKRNPLCEFCRKDGKLVAGNVADHKIPHKGDMKLFFARYNLQTLCTHHHNSTKQRLEKSGEFGCDDDGLVPSWK